jgi:hypothetical protein
MMDSMNDDTDPRTEPEHPAEQLDAAEDVGPEGCSPTAEQVETPAIVVDKNAPEDCEFDVRREIEEQYSPEGGVMVPHPVDGMPVPSDELGGTKLPLDPHFSYEHVCVEDDREWLECFVEEIESTLLCRNDPELMIVSRSRYKAKGTERAPLRFMRARAQDRWGSTFVELTRDELNTIDAADVRPSWAAEALQEMGVVTAAALAARRRTVLLPVRPVRPKCIHFKRQLFNTDGLDPDEPGGKTRYDNCTHPCRRSIGGASMSLRGQIVFACDYRSPAHAESVEQHLDDKDRERLGALHELVPLFNMDSKAGG